MRGAPPQPDGVLACLRGGLGNQLFQYAAARAVAQRCRLPLTVDASHVGLVHDGVGLLATRIPEPVIGEWPKLGRGHRWLAARAVKRRDAKVARDPVYVVGSPDQARMLMDRPLSDTSTTICMDGFFECPDLVDLVERQGMPLIPELKSPSSWYVHEAMEVTRAQPLAVHVRRGDFKNSPAWGLLARDYYERALSALSYDGSTPVWVFSDEPDEARRMLAGISKSPIHVTAPPRASPAVESLLLMAKCTELVCANSTMSWWAGRLSSGRVVLPTPFRARQHHPSPLNERRSLNDRFVLVDAGWTGRFGN